MVINVGLRQSQCFLLAGSALSVSNINSENVAHFRGNKCTYTIHLYHSVDYLILLFVCAHCQIKVIKTVLDFLNNLIHLDLNYMYSLERCLWAVVILAIIFTANKFIS